MKLILLGAPGAGKGTQAEAICAAKNIPAISTGNIIREAMRQGTQLGQKAKQFVDSGNLVPDEIVISMLRERISQDDCKKGFVLDGFPRTVPQAQSLEEMGIEIDRVIDLEVSDAVIAKRLTGRRVCGECSATYHLEYNPSKVEGKCDKCGGELIRRKDDAPETVQERLRVYHELTEPLKDYYQAAGVLYVVGAEADDTVAEITKLALAALEA